MDGQQRLTTITILLRAIQKRLSADAVHHELATELNGLLVKGDDLNLLLLQTNHDSSHIFVDYVREGRTPERSAVQTSADLNLVEAISQCEAFVAELKGADAAVDLVAILRNQLSVIFHEISDESLVYTVFEVLNSRGLDVTWFDKVKAMLMSVVFEHGDRGGKQSTIEELHQIWKDIYRTIGTRQTLNRETLRFAATLIAKQRPNRPLAEEDAATELIRICGTSSKKAVELSRWLLKVSAAETRLLSNHRQRAVTQIVQARLAAIAIMLAKYTPKEEAELLQSWENVTFRIYGLGGYDARTAVGEYVRLAWGVLNESLSASQVRAALKTIGQNVIPLTAAIDELRGSDVYPGRAEMVRYFMFRYEEHLAQKAGQKLNESQWNRIWADEPARSIEHIKPQSSGVAYLHNIGNLTMLPPGMNSKLKDRDPASKTGDYETCGLICSADVGRLIRQTGWSNKVVQDRQEQLLYWAKSAWKD